MHHPPGTGAFVPIQAAEQLASGRRVLGDPRPDEVITEDSIATALRTTFRPEAAGKTKALYLLRLGEIEVHARIRDGAITVKRGGVAKPDLIIETGPALRLLMANEISPAEAIKKRLVRIHGDPKLFDRFVQMFRI